MIKFRHIGDFSKTTDYLEAASTSKKINKLEALAREGVTALSEATPVDTGLTAKSWGYEIEQTSKGIIIRWTNHNVHRGINIAILLQYDHATGTGGLVEGRDYINPAIQPIFDKMAEEVCRRGRDIRKS